MKRFLILLAVAALLLSMLAGCGNANGEVKATDEVTAAPSADVSTGEPAQEPELEPTAEVEEAYFPRAETEYLSMWYPYPPILGSYADGPEDFQIFTEAAKRLNVEIEFQAVSIPAAAESMGVMLASGDYTDIIMGMFGSYTGTPEGCFEDGVILELTDYLESYLPNYLAAVKSQPDYEKQCLTEDGRSLLVYTINSKEDRAEDYGLVVRQDWLDSVDMDIPQTLDEYHEVLTAFKTELGKEGALWLPYTCNYEGAYFGSCFGVDTDMADVRYPIYVVDGEVKFGPIQDEYKSYLETMSQWYSEGLIYSDFISYTDTYIYPEQDKVTSGVYGIFATMAKNLHLYDGQAADESYAISPSYAPVLNEGDQLHLNTMGLAYAQLNSAAAVSTDCENIELACRYLDYWWSEDGYYLANYGIEGEQYEIVDGAIQYTESFLNFEGGQNLAMALYTGGTAGIPYYFANVKFTSGMYSELQMESREVWETQRDNEWNMPPVTLTLEESSEFANLYNELYTYYSETAAKFVMGEKSLDEFDEFREQLIAMGAERCAEIYAAAYERYMA